MEIHGIEQLAIEDTGMILLELPFRDYEDWISDEINALASIPALPVLQAQVLGTMLAPISSFAAVIKAIAEKLGGPVEAEPEAAAE